MRKQTFLLAAGLMALSLAAATAAIAAPAIPAFTTSPAPGGGTAYSLPVQTLILMTALTFIPAALLMMTSFTRIIIVLSLLRQAIGTQTAPPNQVLVGLALFLTLFVMGPVWDRIYTEAYAALQGPDDVPLRLLVPAFITSELKTAFQIGFAIFIPFLIIDMVVASVLMSMGMMMMSPAVISLPFKLMLFVLVDGWQLLLGSLSQSFY